LSRYENGVTDPSASHLAAIASELGVSTDYLLGLSDEPMGKLGEVLLPHERALLKAYSDGDSIALLDIVTTRIKQLLRSEKASDRAE
jgi:transcriptional regulator with XRE-family HTH domain